MRRPVTSLLLLLFLVASLYVARPVRAPVSSPASPPVTRGLPAPTAVVTRAGASYLVAERQAWQVSHAGAGLRPVTLQWIDIPEPSGAGIWQVAGLTDGQALFGLGGPVYPSPARPDTLLLDPGSQQLYEVTPKTAGGSAPPVAVAPAVRVSAVRWAPSGRWAVLAGAGPDGVGVYQWFSRGGIVWLGAVAGATQLAALPDPVVATDAGAIWWRGHGSYDLHLASVAVSAAGTVLGFSAGQAVWWSAGHVQHLPVPGLPLAAPRFSPSGQSAAYVAQVGRASELIVVSGRGVVALRVLPEGSAVASGWIGRRVVVAVLSGPHIGTYFVNP